MNIPQAVAIQRYEMVRDELKAKSPEQWSKVIALCALLPSQIDVEAIWRFGRDKPCFSNITVSSGQRIAKDIALSQDFDSWQQIAGSDWTVTMKSGGQRWKSNDNFDVSGKAISNYVSTLERGGFKSYLWRLYAIRELALALNRGILSSSISELASHLNSGGVLPLDQHERWTTEFGYLAGRGWGYTTAYHMLTDLGVSVKPDIHLTRSVVRMGLLAPSYPINLSIDKISGAQELQHLAAKSAIELSQLITPTACPANPRTAMREVDKVLMEWSRQELARPL